MNAVDLIIENIDDIKQAQAQVGYKVEPMILWDNVFKILKKAKHPITVAMPKIAFVNTAPVVLATLDRVIPVLEASFEGYQAAYNANMTIDHKPYITLDTVDIAQNKLYDTTQQTQEKQHIKGQSEMFINNSTIEATAEAMPAWASNFLARLEVIESELKINPKKKKKEIAPPPPDMPKNYRHWTVSRNMRTGQYRLSRRINRDRVVCKALGMDWDKEKADKIIDAANIELNLKD